MMAVAKQPLAVGDTFDEWIDPQKLIDPTLVDRIYRGADTAPMSDVPGISSGRALDGAAREAELGELLAAFASRTLAPSDLLAGLQSAIGSERAGQEAVVHAISGAMEAAKDSDRRWRDGTARPLEGIPFGVKDIIDVEGAIVSCGSLLTGNRVAESNAAVVASLKTAGAIPFAMTATTEFAAGSPQNPRFGAVTNPWRPDRWTGGSSTGSCAALAARLMPLALGTDTGGSIRVPSCWCATTGLKPSREWVSRRGVAPLSWTLDHVGPMARSARDIARSLPWMVARPDAALFSACHEVLSDVDLLGLRLGVVSGWFTDQVDEAVLANWQTGLQALEKLGCKLVQLPPIEIAGWHEAGWTILQSELATLHGERLKHEDLFDAGMLHRLKTGLTFSAVDYGHALQCRAAALTGLLDLMHDVDLIVTPGLGGEPGHLDSLTVEVNDEHHSFQSLISRNTMIFDVTGLPALMLPSGLGRSGLPTGMQIVGKPGADALCLRLGAGYQSVTDHHRMQPPPRGQPWI